jgi:autotransporter-associated beta strand protein
LAPQGSLVLNAKNLTLNTGAKLQFRLGATGPNDKITNVNQLTLPSSTSPSTPLKWSDFTFIPDANFAGGVYTLIDQTANTDTSNTLITSGLIDSIKAEIRLKNGDLVLETTTPIKTWTGNATGTSAQKTRYNSAGNWSDNSTPKDVATIRFNTMSVTTPIHTTLPENASVFGIQVKNTDNTSIVPFADNRTMIIGAGGITINAGAGRFALGAPATTTTTALITEIQLSADQSWLNNGLAMLITPNGEINLNGKNLTLGGSGSIVINGPITNPSTGPQGTLIKDGTGTLSISGTNPTYSGQTTIKDGTLKLTGSINNSDVTVDRDALLSTTGLANTKSVTLAAGGRLAIEVSATTPNTYNLQAQKLNLAKGDLELNVPKTLGVGTYHVAESTTETIKYPIGKPIKITGIQGKIVKSSDNKKLQLRIRGFDKWRYANINNAHLRAGYTGARNDLYNYAFGLSNVGPGVTVSNPSTGLRSISYTRTSDNDLTYTLEYSKDLETWTTENLSTLSIVSVTDGVTGRTTQTVIASLPTINVPLNEPRLFFRVRVEAN